MSDDVIIAHEALMRDARNYLRKISDLRISTDQELARILDTFPPPVSILCSNPLVCIARINNITAAIKNLTDAFERIARGVRNVSHMRTLSQTALEELDGIFDSVAHQCDNLRERYLQNIDAYLREGKIEVRDVITLLSSGDIDKDGEINRAYLKIFRHFYPFMNEDERAQLRAFLQARINRVLGSSYTAGNPGVQFWMQNFATCSLIPLTPSIPIDELFGRLDVQYSADLALRENLESIAQSLNIGVVYLQKSSKDRFEFQWRPIFDANFIRMQNLISPRYTGLCDRTIARYETIRAIDGPSARAKDDEVRIDIDVNRPKIIILESLAANRVRVLGYYNQPESLTVDAARVPIFARGMSTRADDYNKRAEERMAAMYTQQNQRGLHREAMNIYAKDATDVSAFANTFLNQIRILVREYFLGKSDISYDNKDIQRGCWEMVFAALKFAYMSMYNRAPSPDECISAQKVAVILIAQLIGKKDRLRNALAHDERSIIIEEVINKMRGEEGLFATESLISIFARVKDASK